MSTREKIYTVVSGMGALFLMLNMAELISRLILAII